MQDAGYVFAGWGVTALTLVAYAVNLSRRARRATRTAQAFTQQLSERRS